MLKHDPVGLVRNFETRLDPAFLCSDTFLDQHISRHNWPHWCGINIGNEQFFFCRKTWKVRLMRLQERAECPFVKDVRRKLGKIFIHTFWRCSTKHFIQRTWTGGSCECDKKGMLHQTWLSTCRIYANQ